MTLGVGTAHAADTVLVDCDRVAGSASIKPPLPNTAITAAISTKGPLAKDPADTTNFKPIVTTRDCTGVLATTGDGGNPDNVGNLTKVAAKFSGSATCNLLADPPITDALDPLDGALTLTYTTLTPLLKPWASSTYVRIGGGTNPLLPDELVVKNGIVTKGAGVGADVRGGFIFAPYDAKTKADFDANPATAATVRPNQSFIDANSVVQPGAGSAAMGLDCIGGVTPPGSALGPQLLATAFFGTDGTGLLGGVENSSFSLVLPEVV